MAFVPVGGQETPPSGPPLLPRAPIQIQNKSPNPLCISYGHPLPEFRLTLLTSEWTILCMTNITRPANPCRFATCRQRGADYLVSVIRLHRDGRTLHRASVPICIDHRPVLDDAKEAAWPIVETEEGWVYVDVVPFILREHAEQKSSPDIARWSDDCPARGVGLSHARMMGDPPGVCRHCGDRPML